MTWYSREDAAERAGVEPSLRRSTGGTRHPRPRGAGSLLAGRRAPRADGPFARGRRASRSRAWPRRSSSGALSLDFVDAAGFERFAALAAETFRQVSDRTGIPLELLDVIREAIGMAQPSPDDRLREDEMAIVPFIELQLAEGFRPAAIERLLRVQGDSTRRIAEQEAAWWNSEVIEPGPWPRARARRTIGNADLADRIAPLTEQAAPRDVPRASGARLDRQHHRGVRGPDGEGGHPQPPRAAPGDLLPGSHRLHAADPGTRRRCGRRPGDDARAAGAAQLRAARRQAHQVAGRRRDVLLPRPRPRRARRPGDGGRRWRPPGCRRRTSVCTRDRSSSRRATTSARP